MKSEYTAFLDELVAERIMEFHPSSRADVSRQYALRAQCKAFCVRFVERFPHLRMVAGFYGNDPSDADAEPGLGYAEHWWCVDTDGTIVDPTREQFGPIEGLYTVYDETKHRIQIGRCMNCGDYIYGLKRDGPASVCGLECETVLNEAYNREMT